MAKLVSATYGEALYELAVEEGKADELLSEVCELKDLLDTNPDFRKLMTHPKILKEEKTVILKEVFEGRISGELLGFMNLVVSKGRYDEMDAILDYFIAEIKKLKGIGTVYVTTAGELSEAKKKEIEEKLLSTTSYQKMEMHYQTDESLIGGIVIRIGDRIVDGSVRTKLTELQKELLKVQLS